MRTCLLLAIVLPAYLVLCPFAAAQPAKARPNPAETQRPVTIDVTMLDAWTEDAKVDYQRAEDKLGQRISVDHEAAKLGQVLSALADELELNLDVNWPALELVGIDGDSPVSLRLRDVPARIVLSSVFNQISAEQFDDDKAIFTNYYGIIRVSTKGDLKMLIETRIYDIRPLLREPYRPMGMIFDEDAFDNAIAFNAWARGQRAYPFTDALLIKLYQEHIAQMTRELDQLEAKLEEELDDLDVPEPRENAPGGGGGRGGGLFADDPGPDMFSKRKMVDEIVHHIENTVGEPDAWLDEESTIDEVAMTLVIKTTLPNHRQIETLLNARLQAELRNQVSVIQDAEACRLLYEASVEQEAGRAAAALDLVERALLVDPDHLPANAMREVYAGIVERGGDGAE